MNLELRPFFRSGSLSRLLPVLLLVLVARWGLAQSAGTNAVPARTLYYIPHTHWEGAVFKTREEYLEMGLPNILKAIQLLKQNPDYKFALDQVAYFRPFLERYPEEADAFRKFVKEGRLEIVGGMDVMPDDVKPGGELFVRQLQYGKQYCREQLGVDVTVAWMVDTFGHHPQMPQLLKLAGYQSFWFCRGVPRGDLPSEFFWQGIDGTRIPAVWLPGFYGLFYGPPRTVAGFNRFFEDRFQSLDSHAQGPERVGLAGVDVSEPESYVPSFLHRFNERSDAPFTIRYSVPSEFDSVVSKRSGLPVLTNDFNPIFQGTYSSRIELKQTTRRIEQRLLAAEMLGGIAGWLGVPADSQKIWRAWEPVLFNQTHDLASGVMTDHVYEDAQRGNDYSSQLADELVATGSGALLARVDTRGEGVPVVVFNPSGWLRSDLAEVELGFAGQSAYDLQVVDSEGKEVAVQVVESERYADNSYKRARVAFIARDVPSVGYAVYHLRGRREPPAPSLPVASDGNLVVLQNEYYRVTVDRLTGALTSILDTRSRWEVLSGPANVVSREVDKGDLWELYQGLDGASYIAHTNQQAWPKPGTAQFSNEFSDQPGRVTFGPVFSEVKVAHPFGKGSFATRIRLYRGLPRIEIETDLVNQEKFVRYQVRFPTSITGGRNLQSIPFGSCERPVGVEFPAQEWVDYGNDLHGLALLNFGLPGNLVLDNTLMLSLLRAHNLGGYGYGGGYEPGMSSESGFELGTKRTFRYALQPRTGDWRSATPYRAGMEFNQPLLVYKTSAHSGPLSARKGFLEILDPGVTLCSLRPAADGGWVVRVCESNGQPVAKARLRFGASLSSAIEVNLLEEAGEAIATDRDTVEFALHPFQIKSIKVRLAEMAR